MKANRRNWKLVLACLLGMVMMGLSAQAQVVSGADLKKVVPAGFFYAGQSASVQARNSSAIKNSAGKFTLAGLVDTSGYSTAVAEKYQGFFITETKVTLDGGSIEPGAYGFGFKDGKFLVMNIAGSDVVSVASQKVEALKHPVPLKFEKADAGYRLYAGRNYVTLKVD